MPDLYFSDAEPSGTECKAVDTAVGSLGPATLEITDHLVYSGHKRVQERRHLLLPTLHALQKAVGWISPGGLNYACKVLQIPPAEAFGVVTFYHLFSTEEPDQTPILHVCEMDF